jgi:hypothetical protein
MSEQEFLLPGYYKLIAADISPYGSTDRVDISAIIHKIVIEESIENDSIRGYISVADGVGLLEILPLRGEERLFIEVEDILKNKKIFDLFVYKVENVLTKEANDILFYDMVFVSYMRWNAGRSKIIEAFDTSIKNAAEEIFKRYYTPFTKPFETDATDGNFQCVIPNYTPQQALKFLASRAYNSVSPSCSVRFFENSEAFYFVPDEWLIAEAIRLDNIKEFTFIPNIASLETNSSNDKNSYDIELHLKNLIELRNTDRINTINDLYSGAYKSNPIVIDFVNKTVTDNRYSYQDRKTKFASLNAGNKNIEDIHTDEFIDYSFTDENERRFLVFKDYQSGGDLPTTIRSEQHLPEIISQRLTYRHMLYRNTVHVKVYGRLDLKAGDIVKLVIPEVSASDTRSFDSKLSGNYLVHDCTHIFDKEVYEVSMMLTKFDWRKD